MVTPGVGSSDLPGATKVNNGDESVSVEVSRVRG